MTRRSAVYVVAGFVLVALVAVAALFPVPYVVFSPGPVQDTLAKTDGKPVIAIEGAPTYDTRGRLDLTTIGVTSAGARMDLVNALVAWADPRRAVVPRRLVYDEDTTTEAAREENAELLDRSQQSAEVAALRQLGREVSETVVVDKVLKDMPADGVLEPGDVVVAVDGEPVTTPEQVRDAVVDRDVGDPVTLTVRRAGKQRVETLTTVAAENDGGPAGRPVVGFSPDIGYAVPIDVDISIDKRIGGPSAGMVFALAIYDLLTPGALLDGHHVAGTGTISADGGVGRIGGIQQKIAAIGDRGADLFLAPADNCRDISGDPRVRVVPVRTLAEAVQAVEALREGQIEDLPSCSAAD